MTGAGGAGGIWRRASAVALGLAVALLVAGVAIAAYSERAYTAQKTDEVAVQARILAAAVTAALAFEDRSAAQEYVNALDANPEVVVASVFDAEGTPFVTYSRLPPSEEHPADGFMDVRVPVVQGGIILGSVHLRSITEPFASRLERYGGIALLVTMGALVVTVLGAAHTALSRANAELSHQASALAEAYVKLKTETEERERAEDALRQSQKMEAIGQLSGGVAHDFNNLLQAMSGCLRLIERKTAMPDVQPLIEAGRQAVDRGARLTQQLMAFARRQALRPEPVDVGARLHGMSELLARALRADIDLSLDLENGLWPIEVDPTQFELAVLNLAVNARDAMAEGGRLSIEGRNLTLPPGRDPQQPVGDYVRLTVSDTGEGMAPDVLGRAFEPFFTTKGVGLGTGLGLSQVYGFARQSGGVASIESVPGKGTSIALMLPRGEILPAAREPEPVAIAGPGGGRRLLFVEDDPVVGAMMESAIEDLGYVVIRASSADEGLALFGRGEEFDLLFSDVVMPGTASGLDLAREIRRLRPDLPILLTSGYNEGAQAGKEFPLLAKPYRIETLAEALANLVDGRRSVTRA